MPLFLTNPCKVCSTGQPLPPDARFCRNCGREVQWWETARGRRRATAVGGAGLLLFLVVIALLVLVSAHHTQSVVATRVAFVPQVVQPAPQPPVAPAPAPPTPVVPVDPTPPATPAVTPTAPVRPGDTDLSADPLAVYAGGPPADRLSIHGLRIGLPLSDVPVALLDDSEPDHLRDTGGNLYAVDDRRISEVHIRDPDLLARLPIDSTNALLARFGQPADVYRGDGNEFFPTYLYPDRGIHVRWDNAAGRIIEVVLVRPTPQ